MTWHAHPLIYSTSSVVAISPLPLTSLQSLSYLTSPSFTLPLFNTNKFQSLLSSHPLHPYKTTFFSVLYDAFLSAPPSAPSLISHHLPPTFLAPRNSSPDDPMMINESRENESENYNLLSINQYSDGVAVWDGPPSSRPSRNHSLFKVFSLHILPDAPLPQSPSFSCPWYFHFHCLWLHTTLFPFNNGSILFSSCTLYFP